MEQERGQHAIAGMDANARTPAPEAASIVGLAEEGRETGLQVQEEETPVRRGSLSSRKVKLGRPPAGDVRTPIGRTLHGLILRLALRRLGLNRREFAELMDVPKGTVSRWLNGRTNGPAWSDLRSALQGARSNRRPSPSDEPCLWIGNPTSRTPTFQKPNQDPGLDDATHAAQAVQTALSTVPVAAGHDPIIELDRIAATGAVADKQAFVQMMRATLQPVTMSRRSPYRWSGRTPQGLFVQAGPRFQSEIVDPETGEVLEPSFVRVDISGQLLQKPQLLRTLMAGVFGRFVERSSWQVTLIDLAATYNEPHFAVLGLDRRARTLTVRRSSHPFLRSSALNQFFGTKRSSRSIRHYNKRTERADKLLMDPAMGPQLWSLFAPLDPDVPTTERDDAGDRGHSNSMEGSSRGPARFQNLSWPAYIMDWDHAHRIEGSVRPPSRSRSYAIDRHPTGLIRRIAEHANPFKHHDVLHLGVVPRESPMVPILVWARVEGLTTILDAVDAVSKSRAEKEAFRRILFEELEVLAESTEWHGFHHPDVLLRVHADRLQHCLDEVFAGASRGTSP